MYSGATGLVGENPREAGATRWFAATRVYLMAGKMIGLGLVLLLISKWYLPATAYADTAPALPPPNINAINTVWTLVAAYLVFCMQVGFVMLERASPDRARRSTSWSKESPTPASAA